MKRCHFILRFDLFRMASLVAAAGCFLAGRCTGTQVRSRIFVDPLATSETESVKSYYTDRNRILGELMLSRTRHTARRIHTSLTAREVALIVTTRSANGDGVKDRPSQATLWDASRADGKVGERGQPCRRNPNAPGRALGSQRGHSHLTSDPQTWQVWHRL